MIATVFMRTVINAGGLIATFYGLDHWSPDQRANAIVSMVLWVGLASFFSYRDGEDRR